MSNPELREKLLAMERRSPELEARYREEVRAMIEKPLTPLNRVAFVLSGLMAVAYFWRHMPGGFWTIENRGELAMLYCFVFFFLFTIGGGSYSVDTWLRKKS